MSSQFDYRSTSSYPADEVYATMVDPDFLRTRLEQIGGPGAGLLEHRTDLETAGYRLRHGLDAKHLPSMVRNVLPNQFSIERSERWRREGAGHYTGAVDVTIPGAPGSATGVMRLRDTEEGSVLHIRIEVTIKVPMIGGRIESTVASQVQSLLASESAFTQEWLSQR